MSDSRYNEESATGEKQYEEDEDEGTDAKMAAVDKEGGYFNATNKASPPTIHSGRHTKFLDLTNGEGGERPATAITTMVHHNPVVDTHMYHHEHDVDEEMVDSSGVEDSMAHHQGRGTALTVGGTGGLGIRIDPNTPGKVVEAGQEHTGRWTKEEHEAFLSALQMYGKEWKKVAAKVKTRTVVQTRTHAQKYFQKLQKAMEQSGGKEEITHVEMGVAPEAKKASSIRKDKKRHQTAPSIAAKPRPTSLTSAAHLISNLSSAAPTTAPSHSTLPPPTVFGTNSNGSLPPSAAGASPQPPILSSCPPQQLHTTTYAQAPRHGFSTGPDTFHQPATSHSSATARAAAPATSYLTANPATTATTVTSMENTWVKNPMKIVAPDPEATRGKFPEPSPAACGKRKLAEIAAARMLAAVGASGTSKPLLSAAMMGEDNIDGTATPPPSSPHRTGTRPDTLAPAYSHIRVHGNSTQKRKELPAPPLVVGPCETSAATARNKMSLQIVNPDSLGVTFQELKKRKAGDSPVTPWDGQLEALVSETAKNKQKEKPSNGVTDGDGRVVGSNVSDRHITTDGSDNNIDTNQYPHPVCGPGTAYGRTPLHKAVCEMDVVTLQQELSIVANNSEGVLLRRDEVGFCPLHSACAHRMIKKDNSPASYVAAGCDIVLQLLAAGADSSCEDDHGNTPLHWAARAGDKDIAELLLLKNCPQDSKNKRGETPLHWAMRVGRVGMDVVNVLLENGARPSVFSNEFKRPIDVAAAGFQDYNSKSPSLEVKSRPTATTAQKKRLSKEQKKALKEAAEERREVRANILMRSLQSRTLVLNHPECLEHIPKSESDWEAPERILSIMRRVTPVTDSTGLTESSGIFPYEVTLSQEFERASLDILSRVHSTEYLSFVNDLSKDLERQQREATEAADNDSKGKNPDEKESNHPTNRPVVPFTPMVQRSMIKIEESKIKLGNHSDTSFSVGSLKAARRAAGAVQHAVDCVLVGRNRNAFCVVRPPGHHAGIGGLLDGGESCGFCIFNNVAAGALHAISDERLLCERCAIVDIDVHHGNGTEEIVRRYHDPGKLFFFSIHLYDNDKDKKKRSPNSFQYKFYPGTGSEDDVAFNIINVPIVPLWKEEMEKPVPTNTHNTRQRTKQKQKAADQELEKAKQQKLAASASQDSTDERGSTDTFTPKEGSSKVSDVESESASTKSPFASPRHPSFARSGRVAYRQAIINRLLPALRAFNPDLILISAGFDAAKGDVGNARHERDRERVGLDLDPDDYAWTTRRILEVADICCQGRVVSVLEGGYGRTPLTKASSSSPLDRTIFAECAIRHLHAMVDPYDAEMRFS